MFFMLHRIYVASWIGLVLGALAWIYPRAGLSAPMRDWYEVWQNSEGTTRHSVEHLSGTVIKVTDATAFTLRTPDRQLFAIGLAGVLSPAVKPRPTPEDLEQARQCRAKLSELILSNEVEVALLTLDPQHRGIGVVHMGATNVNAALIQSGLVQFKPAFVKELPFLEQFALFRADRIAKEIPKNQ
jgi:endonuclease YncB( thermonuclease family)